MTLKVRKTSCSTCIYRDGSRQNIKALEDRVRDPHMPRHFTRYRQCHHHDPRQGEHQERVCRGFWTRHADDFTAGQLAQRLGMVEFTDKGDENPFERFRRLRRRER